MVFLYLSLSLNKSLSLSFLYVHNEILKGYNHELKNCPSTHYFRYSWANDRFIVIIKNAQQNRHYNYPQIFSSLLKNLIRLNNLQNIFSLKISQLILILLL